MRSRATIAKDRKSAGEAFYHTFPALRGVQASHEYYLAMCPLRLVPKILLFAEEEVPAELRAQRRLNRSRIPEIARYVTENPKEYVFSALMASVDGRVRFEPEGLEGSRFGKLHLPMSARCILNDGQHRRAAIEEALKIRPELGEEDIAVMFLVDLGLKRSQQMFADLNKHAVRPTKSLGITYEHREPLAILAKELSERVAFFKGMTETEKTTISNRAINLFTLSSIYQATNRFLGKTGKGPHSVRPIEATLAEEFWAEVGKYIPEWSLAAEKKVASAELRRDFIHAHGIALQALAVAGSDLVRRAPKDWRLRLAKLKQVDWRRRNSTQWEGRAMIGGKVSKAHNSVILTSNLLKKALGLPLSGDEEAVEKQFAAGRRERE